MWVSRLGALRKVPRYRLKTHTNKTISQALATGLTEPALTVLGKLNPSNREVTFEGGEKAAKLRNYGLSER